MSKVIIKDEDGKEVAYRHESFFGVTYDVKIGDLHENGDGSRETRNFSGDNVSVEKPISDNIFDFDVRTERKGSVNEEEGAFRKDTFMGVEIEDSPSFKPSRSRTDRNFDNGSSYGSSGVGNYAVSNSSGSGFLSTLLVGSLIAAGVIIGFKKMEELDSSLGRKPNTISAPESGERMLLDRAYGGIMTESEAQRLINESPTLKKLDAIRWIPAGFNQFKGGYADFFGSGLEGITLEQAKEIEINCFNIAYTTNFKGDVLKYLDKSITGFYVGTYDQFFKNKNPQLFRKFDFNRDGKVTLDEALNPEMVRGVKTKLYEYPKRDIRILINEFLKK